MQVAVASLMASVSPELDAGQPHDARNPQAALLLLAA
jgi:hypothetical protein